MRAIAIDASGNIMGDAGGGIAVLYGERQIDIEIAQPTAPKAIKITHNLLSAQHQGTPSFSGEWPNTLEWQEEKLFNTLENLPLHFKAAYIPPDTDTFILQVATVPFVSDNETYLNPAGLVHKVEIEKGTQAFIDLQDKFNSTPVNFNAFYAGTPTVYYVRVLNLTAGEKAGTITPTFSKQVKVLCSDTGASNFEYFPPPEKVYIDVDLPKTKLIEYQRLRWEHPYWMYMFQVVRQPTYEEFYSPISAMSGGAFDSLFSGNSSGGTLMEDYPVGTILDFTPSFREEDKSKWEQAWDAVSGFVSDTVGYMKKLTNWASQAYADIKGGVISYVALNMPLVPDGYRDELEEALTTMVDSGLASVGIPPSLPNFDELTSMGTDYLATVALEAAGIPDTDLTRDMIDDLGNGIVEGASKAASQGGSPNPMNWDFVRQNPSTLRRPAYVIIELRNDTDKRTPAGTLSYSVSTHITNEQLAYANISTMVAGFSGMRDYELFLPQGNIHIPSLLPGQVMEMPIFLTEHIGHPYYAPYNNHVMTKNDFVRMSNEFGKWRYSFTIQYDLPPIEQVVAQRNLPMDGFVYQYTSKMGGIYFDTEQWNSIPRE